MKFGSFIAPFHSTSETAAFAFERDLRLVEALDGLGFDEVWFGEHHSGGSEIVGSPEIMIAAAAARTRSIRLGTGVISLPYHHPLLVADRIVQLDHLTRGRALFGFGPGALPSDALMMGIDPAFLRPRMTEALPYVLELIRGGGPVSAETEWFRLDSARLQLHPYTSGGPELAVASMLSPSGPALAGELGLGLLSLSVASKAGSSFLANHWKVYEAEAGAAGRAADRSGWRCVAPIHIGSTREEARREVAFGLAEWLDYFQRVAALPVGLSVGADEDMIDAINESGLGMIGDVADVTAFLDRIQHSSGGFGTFLVLGHDWADEWATLHSYELLVRKVAPAFAATTAQEESKNVLVGNRSALINAAGGAVTAAIRGYRAKAAQRNGGAPQ
ncbi:LLM class flavin-dependent oxidoreductase [Nocardia sp. NPDC059228]|uniref:LLM class flavin-dependent oxidoreductase n=1 Tax=Nocardia sp. NPDC059228 TaxID=3346777 RepID=UPI0036A6F04B